jgi:hypothetical protein
MLDQIRVGDTIVVWKLDRLAHPELKPKPKKTFVLKIEEENDGSRRSTSPHTQSKKSSFKPVESDQFQIGPRTRNATSDFKASADITNTKKVRRLAAVCSSFASTAFQCFLPD